MTDALFALLSFEGPDLVGLEVMAAGGVAVTGDTGEDYPEPFQNAPSRPHLWESVVSQLPARIELAAARQGLRVDADT